MEESQWLEEARDVQAGPGSALVQDLKASRELWAQALPSRSSQHPWADHMGCAGEHSQEESEACPRHTVLRLGGRVGSHIYRVPIVCCGPLGGTSHLASHLVLKAICRVPVTTPILQMKRPRLKEVTFTVSSNQDGRSAGALSPPAFSLPSVWVRGCGKDLMEEMRCEELEGSSTVPVSPLRLCGGGRESGI